MRMRSAYALLILLLLLVGAPALAQNGGRAADPQQVKANLKTILDSREFQAAQPADPSLYEKAARWLREQWDKIMERLRGLFKFGDGGVGKSPGVQWVFIALFIAVGTYVARRLIRSYLATRKTTRAKARTAFDLDDTEEEISREPNDWLEEARRREEEGDYRRAYRALFLAVLLKLDQAGVVAFERGRTNGEYLRSLRRDSRPYLHDALTPLVLEFDLRWYGDKPTTAEDAAKMRVEYDRLSQMLAPQSNKKDETLTQTNALTPEQA